MNKTLLFLMLIPTVTATAQVPCEDGTAAGYPCSNIDLLTYMEFDDVGANGQGVGINDIWGWTDPEDQSEYVILCRTDGTSFIDISDPLNPVYLGNLATHTETSTWRDPKVYNNYAFIVSEAPGHGMQVFDLTELRDVTNPPVEFEETAHYGLVGNSHNIAINEESGFAYAVGTNTFVGGLHIIDISDPENPQLAGGFGGDTYTHDAQAVNYHGPDEDYNGQEIVFASNEDAFTIVNVEDKTDCQMVSRNEYEGNVYAHQGWLTEDHKYFLLGDEIDEGDFGHNTKTYVWDVQDLDNPILVGTHFGPTPATDHNMYILGNYVYQSNYNAGLRILEMGDLSQAELTEIAFFDIVPETDENGYQGSWSNYPYFSSGIIAVSGRTQGLFLLKPGEGVIQGVDDAEQQEALVSVFPNPASTQLNIGFSNLNSSKINLEIVDLSGRITKTFTNLPIAGGTFQLDISGMAPGVYAVHFPGSVLEPQRFIVR